MQIVLGKMKKTESTVTLAAIENNSKQETRSLKRYRELAKRVKCEENRNPKNFLPFSKWGDCVWGVWMFSLQRRKERENLGREGK